MNESNSTQLNTSIRTMLLVIVFFTATFANMMAQAPAPACSCKGSIQVSLDDNCEAIITILDLLTSPTTCGLTLTRKVTLMKTKTGGVIAGPSTLFTTLTDGSLYVGKTIYGKVEDASGLNSCWTEIKIEDKIKPTWARTTPDTCVVTCPSLGTYIPLALDNCHTPRVYQVSESIIVNDCNLSAIFAGPDTLKQIIRKYKAIDESGNISDNECTVVIYVTTIKDVIWPKIATLQCDDDYAKLANGRPSPVAIGTKFGSGVPSLYPWLPTIKNGTYWIGRSGDGLRDSVALSVNANKLGSAQVCLTSPGTQTLVFRNGCVNLGAGGSINYTKNGTVVTTYTGPNGCTSSGLPTVALVKGDIICVNLIVSTSRVVPSTVTFGLDTVMTGIPLTPDAVNDCNIYVTYTDTEFPAIKCVKKIMRRWTVLEWSCSSRFLEYNQLIEIVDSKGPVISGLKDDVATTNGHTCEGLYKLQKPVLKDNCSTDLSYDVTVYDANQLPVALYKGLKLTDTDKLAQLPLGCISIDYTAFDECHNQTTKTISIFVEDNTPPVTICKQNTTVALTLDGKAWVPASSFDNGSYDECDLAKVLVRRMNPEFCKPCKTPTFPGFTYIGEYIDATTKAPHYYYVSKHRVNPRIAAKTAAAMGGYLVHLNNSGEDKWVYDKYKEWNLNEDYTIGLRDEKNKGVFSWYSGYPGTYRNWETAYPIDTIITVLNPANDYPYVRTKILNGKWINFASEQCRDEEFLYVVEIEDPCGFSENIEFCCADVSNSPQVVVLRAIDKSGNWNDCMVNATVQDKLPPRITCPPHMTVSCRDFFDVARLSESFGWPTAYDNCENTRITTDSLVELTGCRTGRITRHFTATDPGGRTATCTQIIMVIGGSDFRPTSFPRDTLIEACDDPTDNRFSIDNLGKPNISTDNTCSLAAYNQSPDEIYNFNNSPGGDACFKIFRTWTVIDWCKFAPNTYIDTKGTTTTDDDEVKEYPKVNYDGSDIFTATNTYDDRRNRINTWKHIQVIKVVDKGKPIISCPAAKTVCSYDPNCASGYIELAATATDLCTQVLNWSYKIDEFNDGSFESGLSKSGLGNAINATGTYKVGTHKIVYSFEDRCGNLSSCEQLFTIKNCKAPTPYCLNGLATSLMPVDTNKDGRPDIGMVAIWASDFNNGSKHPCPNYSVAMSFSPVTAAADGTPVVVPGRTYTCDSLIGKKEVKVYFAAVDPKGKVVLDDNNRVVQDFCSTFITIQDNFNVCGAGAGGRYAVNGTLTTESDVPVKDVSVYLEGSEKTMMTGNTGSYNFNEILGGSYMVRPFKNDDHINGVSTLDLVMIQRHILGIEKLNSPYKLIAADVNKDQKVTASDLIELRKLILGVTNSFADNNSWRFVDKTYKFQDLINAQAESFPEVYSMSNITSNMQINFYSVKVGDVNGNVKANANDNNTESRTSQQFALTAENQIFTNGQTVQVPVNVGERNGVTGFQFTVHYDTDKFSLEAVNGGLIGMTDNNFGFSGLANGILTVSYNREKAMEMSKGDNVITLTFKAKSNGTIAEALQLNSELTKAEAYTASNDVMNIDFTVTNRIADAVVLYQNTPNPFKAITVIGFDLPESMNATLTVYDVTGKKVRQYKQDFIKGYNSVEINKNELGSAGVMYYTLEAGDFKATKKMVVIE